MASEKTSLSTDHDRRRFFRIDDEIILFFREVSAEQVPDIGTFSKDSIDNYSLRSALEHIGQETRSQLSRIEQSQPEIAEYLKGIEKKIDILGQAIVMKDSDLSDQPTREVNLSASGIAFASEVTVETGQILKLKMVLPPYLIGVVTYGKVIHCKPNDADNDKFPYRIGVEFFDIQEEDREILIRHIMKKQMQQIRTMKENPEESE